MSSEEVSQKLSCAGWVVDPSTLTFLPCRWVCRSPVAKYFRYAISTSSPSKSRRFCGGLVFPTFHRADSGKSSASVMDPVLGRAEEIEGSKGGAGVPSGFEASIPGFDVSFLNEVSSFIGIIFEWSKKGQRREEEKVRRAEGLGEHKVRKEKPGGEERKSEEENQMVEG